MMRKVLFFLLVASAARLQAQATLSIQGVIKNADGTAVSNGKYSLEFKLYPSASGGTAVWTETQPEVQVTGGIYSALLGEVNPLTAAFDQPYYLGVAVEGGAELIPRARLTSSPYALSLIGQGNAFPSTGPVGVGTATPAIAGQGIHLMNSTNGSEANLLVESVDNMARLTVKNDGKTGEVQVYNGQFNIVANDTMPMDFSAGNDFRFTHSGNLVASIGGSGLVAYNGLISSGTGQDLVLRRGPTEYMRLDDDVLVVAKGIQVNGQKSISHGNHYYMYSGGTGYGGSQTSGVAVNTGAGIHAATFRALSDRRIKKNFRPSDGAEDLAALMRLRITDYQYVDAVEKGTSFYKGLVAQEVKEIMPAAVATNPGFVPDIFSLSEQTAFQTGRLTIRMAREHQLAAGDMVRFILEDASEKDVTVLDTPDLNSFSVAWTEKAPEKIFVYGKEVDDVQQVDYDQVHNLAISSIQELSRRLDALKAENAGLKSDLKAAVDGFEHRLRTLEANLSR